MVRGLLFVRRMLPSRWSHLARYGLIGSSLLGASTARAEPCDYDADGSIALVIGVQLSPATKLVGGIEGRRCINDQTEAVLRFEVGGGAPRFMLGARVRPFESPELYDHDLALVGVEAGGVLDTRGKLGLHLAGTYGTHSAYLAVQAHIKVTEDNQPMRWTILGGFAPWTIGGSTAVPGRPVAHAGAFVLPRIAGHLVALRSAEARAARAHFVESARHELSSVWTFMRLAAELAAVDAPAHLIAAALDAADDEVRHAMACAEAAGGLSFVALPPSAARPRFTVRSTHALALLAAEAWCEGCLNEGAAAEEARIAAEHTTGDRRAILATIARDEAGHAELSWAVLAWLQTVAPDVVRIALAAISPVDETAAPAHVDGALVRYGVPTRHMTAAARAHAERIAHARLAELEA
jgi:hypothetical protein